MADGQATVATKPWPALTGTTDQVCSGHLDLRSHLDNTIHQISMLIVMTVHLGCGAYPQDIPSSTVYKTGSSINVEISVKHHASIVKL